MPRIRGVSVLNNPALAGNIPTPALWLQPQIVFTGTSTNGSATISSITTPVTPAQFVTTGNIFAGALLFGPGLPLSGTTVSAVASVNSLTAAVNATTALGAGTGLFTVASVDPSQSAFAGNWPGYMLPPVSGDTPAGCLVEVPFTYTLPFAAQGFVLPPGDLMLSLAVGSTTCSLQAWQGPTPSWVTIGTFTVSVTTGGIYVPSDGANFRILAGAATPPTITIYQFR